MYFYIKGKLQQKATGFLVVEAGGVGYQILAGTRTLSELPACGEDVTIYTYFSVREDAMQLFGFKTLEEKGMFERLLGVNSVGPKVAMSVLSTLSVAELAIAIATNDIRAISRVPGVGKKTAERLILELREKISDEEIIQSTAGLSPSIVQGDKASEAIQALMTLGYSSLEASKAVNAAASDPSLEVEDLIMQALRAMDTHR